MTSHRENAPADLLRELIAAKNGKSMSILYWKFQMTKDPTDINLEAAKQLTNAGVKVQLDHKRVTTHSKSL